MEPGRFGGFTERRHAGTVDKRATLGAASGSPARPGRAGPSASPGRASPPGGVRAWSRGLLGISGFGLSAIEGQEQLQLRTERCAEDELEAGVIGHDVQGRGDPDALSRDHAGRTVTQSAFRRVEPTRERAGVLRPDRERLQRAEHVHQRVLLAPRQGFTGAPGQDSYSCGSLQERDL